MYKWKASSTLLLKLIIIAHLIQSCPTDAESWSILEIQSDMIQVHMNEMISIPFVINSSEIISRPVANLTVKTLYDQSIAKIEADLVQQVGTAYYGQLNVTGVFLGSTKASIFIDETEMRPTEEGFLEIVVIRPEQLIDTIFTISVAVLISFLYINFGCAIDWKICRSTLARPVGATIGFLCQFCCMPLLSYGLGQVLFPERPELQMGLFFTGISPGGGASNIWTVLLGGNLNLSVTMTTLCTVAAFGTMPFWIFTLGKQVFAHGRIPMPYRRIATLAVALIIPLAIGLVIQKKMPKLSKLLVRLMKPCSFFLVAFIIIFAIATNLYLFQLFSTQIVIAGMALPWLGFLLALLIAYLLRQPYPDVIAIAIETGIQNTGIAVFLSKFALQPPAADISTVIPVSVAIMTPIPLTIIYLINLIRQEKGKPDAASTSAAAATAAAGSDREVNSTKLEETTICR